VDGEYRVCDENDAVGPISRQRIKNPVEVVRTLYLDQAQLDS